LSSGNRLIGNAGVYWQSDLIFGGSSGLLPTEQILRQNAYALVSARLTYEFRSDNMAVSLFARNLADREYYQSGASLRTVGISYRVPGEPRFVGLQFTKSFGK
jgi:outer membrane receptor protein involved in Fe transport